MKNIQASVTGGLDGIVTILGIVLSLVLAAYVAIAFNQPVQLIAPSLAIVACTGYLLIRKRASPTDTLSLGQTRASPWLYIMLNILFFLFAPHHGVSDHRGPLGFSRDK